MKLELLSNTNWEELENLVRQVPLLKTTKSDGSPIFVYEHADISLRTVSPEEVNPTSFYALKTGLQTQRELRRDLLEQHGIDTLTLTGLLRFRTDDGKEFGLMPPVVEVQTRTISFVPNAGEIQYHGGFNIKVLLLNDGVHRFMIAREEKSRMNVVHIIGANPDFPFYAHPNSWADVRIVDSVPATKSEKKLYSREDCNSLYRNFGIFNCGTPRGTSA